MALVAPRSLNEPIGCRFSSLSQTSPGASAFRRTRGVRTVTPAKRSRAARMSSRVGAVRGCIAGEVTGILGRGLELWPCRGNHSVLLAVSELSNRADVCPLEVLESADPFDYQIFSCLQPL